MSADCLSICSLVRWSLCWRWMSEEARKTWIPLTPQLIAVSMSSFSALARPQTSALSPAFAIMRMASCSPLEVIGNPASMTSTPSLSSACAISSFSSGVSETPGVCSPSRSVVSNTRMSLSWRSWRTHLLGQGRDSRSLRCPGRWKSPASATNSSICLADRRSRLPPSVRGVDYAAAVFFCMSATEILSVLILTSASSLAVTCSGL